MGKKEMMVPMVSLPATMKSCSTEWTAQIYIQSNARAIESQHAQWFLCLSSKIPEILAVPPTLSPSALRSWSRSALLHPERRSNAAGTARRAACPPWFLPAHGTKRMWDGHDTECCWCWDVLSSEHRILTPLLSRVGLFCDFLASSGIKPVVH